MMRNPRRSGGERFPPPSPSGREGLTLVEVMVSLLVVTAVAGVLVKSVRVTRAMSESSAQYVTAFGLCQAKLEQARSTDYIDLTATNFPAETGIPLTHLGGRGQQSLVCNRTVAIQDCAGPARKEVLVTVAWQFRGRPLQQELRGVIYP